MEPTPQTLAEVEEAVTKFMEELDYQYIQNLFKSMPERIQALLTARGGNTKY